MMFSSNQVLEVSGNLHFTGGLESALEFALKYSGHDKDLTQAEIDRGCKLVYQITESGKYCIGWGFENVPNGWSEYPFKFDINIVSSIIRQHLAAFPVESDDWDGSYMQGFLMKACKEWGNDDIVNSGYCIVYFEPFTCYYSK